MSIILGYEPSTLREKVDLIEAGIRLAELEGHRDAPSLNEQVGLLRLVGRIDDAWDAANEALRNARVGGEREEVCLARIRRAQVQQARGKSDAALVELTACLEEARAHDWLGTEAFALHYRGRVHFELEDFAGALEDFREALALRERTDAPAALLESSRFAVGVAERRLGEEALEPEGSALPQG